MPTDQRHGVRVACSLPARLHLTDSSIDVVVLDIGRTGLRLRLMGRRLGIQASTPMSIAIAKVAGLMGRACTATFLPDVFGARYVRTLRPVRIGLKGCALPEMDVGCSFAPPLDDADASILGIQFSSKAAADAARAASPAPRAPGHAHVDVAWTATDSARVRRVAQAPTQPRPSSPPKP